MAHLCQQNVKASIRQLSHTLEQVLRDETVQHHLRVHASVSACGCVCASIRDCRLTSKSEAYGQFACQKHSQCEQICSVHQRG